MYNITEYIAVTSAIVLIQNLRADKETKINIDVIFCEGESWLSSGHRHEESILTYK